MSIQLRALCCLVMIGVLSIPLTAGKKLTVRVIDKVDNATTYTYVVPGYSGTTTTANASCFEGGLTTNCTGSSKSATSTVPTTTGRYEVGGATLSLQLPDGRVAVVNCDSKVNWGFGSGMNPRRSCRIPTVSTLEADFDGDKVTLRWRLGIDGEKGASETYKLLAALDKR